MQSHIIFIFDRRRWWSWAQWIIISVFLQKQTSLFVNEHSEEDDDEAEHNTISFVFLKEDDDKSEHNKMMFTFLTEDEDEGEHNEISFVFLTEVDESFGFFNEHAEEDEDEAGHVSLI